MTRIRRRLRLMLGGLIVAVSALQFGVSFSTALDRTNRLFDEQMQQIAHSLSLSGAEALPGVEEDFHSTYDLVIQMWHAGQVTVLEDREHRSLPRRAPLGYSNVTLDNGEWRVYATRHQHGVVQVAQKLSMRRKEAISLALHTLWPMLLLSLVLLAAMAWAIKVALRPLDTVRAQIAGRDATTLSPVDISQAPAEVMPLLLALNGLLARVADNVGLQRQFVANAAHELRSPLTVLRMQIQMLGREQPTEQRQASLAVLAAAIARSSRMAEQLLGLAQQDALGQSANTATEIALGAFAADAIAEIAPFAASRQIELSFSEAAPVSLHGHADSLMILLRNLLDNAIRYTPHGGAVSIAVERHAGRGVLTIADSGPGIPEVELPRATERFYRVPGSGDSGSGLGLSIVATAAQHLGARLVLRNAGSGGLIAQLTFN